MTTVHVFPIHTSNYMFRSSWRGSTGFIFGFSFKQTQVCSVVGTKKCARQDCKWTQVQTWRWSSNVAILTSKTGAGRRSVCNYWIICCIIAFLSVHNFLFFCFKGVRQWTLFSTLSYCFLDTYFKIFLNS